ncbi:MAG: phosphate ABC transporter permease subunit PstC [Chloroflexi bacterium]|nr:MAG: phosphate ABC transporter permease subunit PstC [Chloroflexota bacterium]
MLEQAASLPRKPLADRLKRTAEKTTKQGLTKKTRLLDRIIGGFLFICGFISILTTVGFIVVLGSEALRFFATTEWLNANKNVAVAVDAEQTQLTLSSGGLKLQIGDIIGLGINREEVIEIIDIIDEQTIIVQRGVEGTQAIPHPARTPIYIGKEVTLTKYLSSGQWAPQIGNFSVMPLISATLRVTLIAILVAVPIGLGAAIYLSEYASEKVRKILKPVLEVLAGIPTVVYGYFALTFVTPLLQSIFNDTSRSGLNGLLQSIFGSGVQNTNAASAGLVVGILIIPTIASISEDSIRAVPRALREASYGLGATRLETTLRVLLPAALSGISAAIILGISRAVGETMIVLIAAGAGPNLTANNFEPSETMAGHIARISTGDISFGSIDYNSVFAIGLTLFLMTLLLNFISTIITRRFREVYA